MGVEDLLIMAQRLLLTAEHTWPLVDGAASGCTTGVEDLLLVALRLYLTADHTWPLVDRAASGCSDTKGVEDLLIVA